MAIVDRGLQIAYRPALAGGVRWRVAPEYHDLLLGPDGLRLGEWLASGLARVVKHGPHRTVYRVELPGLDVHVKHFRLPDARSWLRQCVRPSKARLELDRSLAVAARGVPTVEPLALGETAGVTPGDSFLVTRTLDDVEPLGAFLERTLTSFAPTRQARVRQRVALALADLLARLHDAGVRHDDLHAGNLLVRLGADDEPVLFPIDLHAVRFGAPLDWRAGRDNLVLLNRWFVLRAGRADRLRFFEAYHVARFGGACFAKRARELEEHTWASNLRFWAQRDRRCLVDNRYYRCVRSAVAAGHVVADLDRAAADALLADPDEPFRRAGAVVLKDSRSSTVIETDVVVNGEVRRAIYKRFRATPRDPWLALLRRTSALRSWVFGHGLRERWLPTPRPLAVLHRRQNGLLSEGYLLTEKVANALELGRFVAGLASLPDAERRAVLRRLVDAVARLVRDLHRRRLSHRDLKAANLLVQQRTDGSPALWLIDLVGVRRHRSLSRRRRVRDLARLNASFSRGGALTRADRVRFLRVYLSWGLGGKPGWKGWWREVDEATTAKELRNRRNGRPLA